MFKLTDYNNKIFKSDSFIKDEMAFNVMIHMIENCKINNKLKIYSDNENCIIADFNNDYPIFVWNADNFENYDILYEFIKKECNIRASFVLFSKYSLYNHIKKQNPDINIYKKDIVIQNCPKLINVEYKGKPDNIKENEINIVANMLRGFEYESKNEICSIEKCVPEAEKFTYQDTHKVWRNVDGKITTIALVNATKKFSRIGKVFTIEGERGNSYAQMLVHHITKQETDKGKIPILSTYSDNISANKCYQNIGYIQADKVIYYKIS